MKLSDNKSILWGWSNSEQGVTDKSSGQCKPQCNHINLGGLASLGHRTVRRWEIEGAIWDCGFRCQPKTCTSKGERDATFQTFMFARGGR